MTEPDRKEFAHRVAEALGASKTVSLPFLPSQGPLDLLHLRAEVQRRLRSSGGRPTDPRWDIVRTVRFRTQTWKFLEELARAISREGRGVSPAQVAAILLEQALSVIAGNLPSSNEAKAIVKKALEQEH